MVLYHAISRYADRVDAQLLQAAGVTQLKAPRKPDLQFLQDWLDDEKEGGKFLQGDERTTWNNTNLRDFVTLLIPEEASGSSTQRPNAYLLNWYQKTWGGHKSVRHEEKVTRTTANKLQHAKAAYNKDPPVINYGDSKAGETFSQLALTIVISIFSALTILWLYYVKGSLCALVSPLAFPTYAVFWASWKTLAL